MVDAAESPERSSASANRKSCFGGSTSRHSPTEMKAPTLLAVASHRGTEISNPFPSSEESANHRFLSGGARLGLDESAGYAGTRPTPLSRALIRLRKAGLTQHVENCGTNSSNPPLSSKESANHRFPRARQIDRRSDEASKPKPYLRAVLQVRIHLPPAESPVNSAPAGEKDE